MQLLDIIMCTINVIVIIVLSAFVLYVLFWLVLMCVEYIRVRRSISLITNIESSNDSYEDIDVDFDANGIYRKQNLDIVQESFA